ncbi:Zn(II)2Cys6 transcription factor [Aspergillus saccharolyticus JOP 1030-1]|uniref:Putative Zn(II)2Cys6 transcription factor n=1 Tax=Aspergillus saccharolyticus JOP 1030-1 TaxID=1450539 RepID=A0A318Z6X2_9EURO|nr:putative Zn(II)2Cys6 transcription factor [Aspergillus saccharolyticus JOP 1030-1]PYH40463.1 putative Zn(II)2Cys6 transcription factor [Aspergillus saccharolyticus JOP 1030-1]
MDPLQRGNLKRIRQACANCRRRKTRCSGERPICFHCRRNKHSCIYEPYSVTVNDNPPNTSTASTSENTQLLQRISLIESRLAELSGHTAQQPRSSIDSELPTQPMPLIQPAVIGLHPLVTPSPSVLDSIIDTYFLHVHNQPYSNFQETGFRQELQNGTLPRCLIQAVLASAVRFTTHEFYAGRVLETSEVYAREAWLSVLTDHLTVEDNVGVHVVRTVNMLAVIDYTAGRVNSGWLKIGLAARISQGLGLMSEPDACLPAAEQEDRRRAFWSVYLLDKLISSGRSRPIVILDQDCHVQLPCDENAIRRGEKKKTYTLHQLLNWNTEIAESPSPFALVILLASIFGRCTRYVYANRQTDEIPPWDTKSEYTAISSSLLLFESYAKSGIVSVIDTLRESAEATGTPNHQEMGHQIFAHTLFHLCHCLLNHPFVLSLCLQPFGSKVPHSFVTRALQNGLDHATQLVALLRDVFEAGGLVESSFYAYCLAIAGGVLSIASQEEHQSLSCRPSEMLERFQDAVDMLDRLAQVWTHAAYMSIRLRDFHAQRHDLSSVLDPTTPPSDLDPMSDETLWSMLEYSTLGSNPRKTSSASGSDVPSIPLSTFWDLGSNMPISPSSPSLGLSHADMFRGLSPALRLNEVNFL